MNDGERCEVENNRSHNWTGDFCPSDGDAGAVGKATTATAVLLKGEIRSLMDNLAECLNWVTSSSISGSNA